MVGLQLSYGAQISIRRLCHHPEVDSKPAETPGSHFSRPRTSLSYTPENFNVSFLNIVFSPDYTNMIKQLYFHTASCFGLFLVSVLS